MIRFRQFLNSTLSDIRCIAPVLLSASQILFASGPLRIDVNLAGPADWGSEWPFAEGRESRTVKLLLARKKTHPINQEV